jgi:hypothetical protein
MELGILVFLTIVILLFVAASEYSRFNCITPWPAFLIATCSNSLLGYYFIPAASFGLEENTGANIVAMADTAALINLTGIATTCITFFFVFSLLNRGSQPNSFLLGTKTREFFGFANISDRSCAIIFGVIAIFSAVIIFSIMAYSGVFPLLTEDINSNRGFINDHLELRPIFNLATSTTSTILVFVTLMLILKAKELPKLALLATVVLIGCSLLTGTRSFVGGVFSGLVISFSLLWLLGRSKFKVSFSIYLLYQIVIVFLGGLSGLIRDLSPSRFFEEVVRDPIGVISYSFISSYTGNNFCDLRDFSWILSKFDGNFYLGKTILAGVLNFLPSAIFPFRDEFTIGRVTNVIVGLPTDTHFGLRASNFGEWYLNFGWLGVIIEGLILGIGYAIVHNLFSAYFQRLAQGQEKIKIFTLSVLYFLPSIPETMASLSPFFILYTQALILFITHLFSRSLTDPSTELPDQETITQPTSLL